MRHRCAFAVVLLLGLGCAGGDKGQWDEFWKDVRGDNMKMRSDPWGKEETVSPPAPARSHD
jgi:hypothetical protein